MTTHHISRRGLLAGSAGSAGLAGLAGMSGLVAAAGCGPSSSAASGTSSGEPISGGTLKWGIETVPLTLNPHVNGQNKSKLLLRNQFDALLGRTKTGKFVPWLASKWAVSKDGHTYVFTIRDGVTFHDGERLDAAVVKANFDQLRKPDYSISVATVNLADLESVTVVDSQTVKFVLQRPRASFLDFLSHPNSGLISPKSLRSAKNLTAGGPDVVGSGPFILESYVEGQEIRLKRNPAYRWAAAASRHRGPAYLERLTYRILPEAATRVGALTSGQVDVVEGVPATEIAALKGDQAFTFASALNSGSPYILYFNTSREPSNDVRVRRAFREAVDVDAVLESVYFGHATRAWSIVSRTSPFYDSSFERTYGGNPKLTNSLLDDAGWTKRDSEGFRTRDGKRLTLRLVASSPYIRDRREVLLQAVQAAVKQTAGIDFDVKIVDEGTADNALKDNAYEVFQNSRGDSDVGDALNLLWASGGAINRWSKEKNPKVDGWLSAGSAAIDVRTRKENYRKLQRFAVTEEAIVLPLYVPQDQIAARAAVHGLGFQPVGGFPDAPYDVWIGE